MSEQGKGIDFEHHLRRSRGRDSRNYIASARVNKGEQQELEEAARIEGKALSEWCRETLLGAARRETVTPVFTEVIALRLLVNKALRGDLKKIEDYDAEVQLIRRTKHKAAEEVMQQYAAIEKQRAKP